MNLLLVFLGAAVAEISGCFSFWAWLKLQKSVFWLVPGTFSLWAFAYLLTFVEAEYAGRAYAGYGAIYICASILWMWVVEKNSPDRFDVMGAAVCCIGAAVILFAPRSHL